MNPAFTRWIYKGEHFLAAHDHDGVVIVDRQGRAYGRWMNVARFRSLQREGNKLADPLPNAIAKLLVNVSSEGKP